MLLAWRSVPLKDTCASSAQLSRACRDRIHVAQDLLGAVSHAPTLATLARSRCIRVLPYGRVGRTVTALTIGIEEVLMFATPLTQQGRPLSYIDSLWPEAATVTALRVDDIEVAGASLLKAAS